MGNTGQRTALIAAAVKEDIKVWRKNMDLPARLGVNRLHPEFEKVRVYMSVGWFEAMTLMALETGQHYSQVAALEWGDLDFETHQLRNARTEWQVISPELELHLGALPATHGRKVFDPTELQADKAWARMFIKAGLVPAHLMQCGKQDVPARASAAEAAPAGQQTI